MRISPYWYTIGGVLGRAWYMIYEFMILHLDFKPPAKF